MTLARGLAAEGNSSLSESRIENAETQVTAAALLAQNEDLRRQLSIQQESLKTLTASLAESNAEAQLRGMNELVARSTNRPQSAQPSLMDGSVISVKDEWSFVVGNIGEKQGVKIGMPMRVMRGDKKIGTLRVVDVRQKICGAVIQDMDFAKEKIKVGDRLQVDAKPNVSAR